MVWFLGCERVQASDFANVPIERFRDVLTEYEAVH